MNQPIELNQWIVFALIMVVVLIIAEWGDRPK